MLPKFLRTKPSDRKVFAPRKSTPRDVTALHPALAAISLSHVPAPASKEQITSLADAIDVPRANLLTVIRQESSNRAFHDHGIYGIFPLIRLELHKLNEYTDDIFLGKHDDLFKKYFKLSDGNVSQEAHLLRMNRAMFIIEGITGIDPAFEAASWGAGQVLGSNFRLAGHGTVRRMVQSMATDEISQLRAMTNFIENCGIRQYLANRDWYNFAKHYNGTARATQYARELAANYRVVTGYSA